jgi:hypothetical protein
MLHDLQSETILILKELEFQVLRENRSKNIARKGLKRGVSIDGIAGI